MKKHRLHPAIFLADHRDADYRGEIKVVLVNLSKEPFTVNPGERIAQMVVARHEQVEWEAVETLEESLRGSGGFGSTGK